MTWYQDSPSQPDPGGAPNAESNPNAVWPPPVYAEPSQPTVFHKFNFLYERVDGSVADFRSGQIGVDAGGIIVDGKAQPRAEIYQPILIAALLIYSPLLLIAYPILRYAFLQSTTLAIPWQMMKSITSIPKKRKICLVYDAPNYANVMKTYSLTMQFRKDVYSEVAGAIDASAPGLLQPGKIRAAYSPVVLVWLTCVLISLVAVLVIASMKFMSGGHGSF